MAERNPSSRRLETRLASLRLSALAAATLAASVALGQPLPEVSTTATTAIASTTAGQLVVSLPVSKVPNAAAAAPSASLAALGVSPALVRAAAPELDLSRQLLGVRVRSEGPTLRIVFLFDKPAAYAIKVDAPGKSATIDLIHTGIAYLPANVGRLDDPRLSGIWIKKLDPAMATLELRLASPATRIEHFTLADPPALVIDLTRTDDSATPLGGPRISATLPPPPRSTPSLIRAGGAVVPEAWLDASAPKAAEPKSSATATTSAQTVAALPEARVDVSPTSPSATVAEDSETTATPPGPTIERIESASLPELGPRAEDFDGFPIESIHAKSALAKEMYDDFLGRRWATALNKGLSYLKNNPLNQESIDVLFMLAESRWQLGRLAADPPLGDMTNFYQQALRAHEGGELGSFGHTRLAQAAAQTEDPKDALANIDIALKQAGRAQDVKLLMLKARQLQALGDHEQALRMIDDLKKRDLNLAEKIETAKLDGAVHLEAGDAAGAWKAYADATALDPEWTKVDYDNWERMARAGLGTGHYVEAMNAVQELLRNYDNRDKSANYKLLLLHAELLEKLGDTDIAEKTYETFLSEFGKSGTGAAIQQATRDRFPVEVLQSESNYCMILWKEGKFARAMAELHKTNELCLRDGIDPSPLKAIAQTILPDFMRSQLDDDQPFEAVQAWRLYRHFVDDPQVRARSLDILGVALERLGFSEEALNVLNQNSSDRNSADWTLRKARLLEQEGDIKGALALIEAPLPSPSTPAQKAEASFLLAKAYEASNRPLEAAQAYQTTIDEPTADPERRGAAAAQSGLLFLKEKMPLAAVEIGVKALMIEGDNAKARRGSWSPSTGGAIRLMLARGFFDRDDFERSGILLKDYLAAAADAAPEDKAMARLLVAQCLQKQGRAPESQSALETLINDAKTPALYADQARELQKLSAWDKAHPQWTVLKDRASASASASAIDRTTQTATATTP